VDTAGLAFLGAVLAFVAFDAWLAAGAFLAAEVLALAAVFPGFAEFFAATALVGFFAAETGFFAAETIFFVAETGFFAAEAGFFTAAAGFLAGIAFVGFFAIAVCVGLVAAMALARFAGFAAVFRAVEAAGAFARLVELVAVTERAVLTGVAVLEPPDFLTNLPARALERATLVALGFLASPRFGM